MSWSETQEWSEILGLELPPVLYEGLWNKNKIKNIVENLDLDKQEGFVVRNVEQFYYDDFKGNIAKWVRSNHVKTNKHWMYKEVIPNRLKVRVID